MKSLKFFLNLEGFGVLGLIDKQQTNSLHFAARKGLRQSVAVRLDLISILDVPHFVETGARKYW